MLARFQVELLSRKDGRQPVEPGPAFGLLGVYAIYRLDPQQAEILFVFLGRTYLPDNGVAGPQPKSTYLRLRNIDIV
jgi:hypothetical protein